MRVFVCVCVSLFVTMAAHTSIVLLHGPVSAPSLQFHPPACSPRHLILPGGTVMMWEAEETLWGDYTHYLSESGSNRAATASISSLLTSTSYICSQ